MPIDVAVIKEEARKLTDWDKLKIYMHYYITQLYLRHVTGWNIRISTSDKFYDESNTVNYADWYWRFYNELKPK